MRRLLLALVLGACALPQAAGPAPAPAISFAAGAHGRMTITAPAYRLVLAQQNGTLVELVDRRTGARLLGGSGGGCLWQAVSAAGGGSVGGCGFTRNGPDRFSYRWDRRTTTLTLAYDAQPGGVDAQVSIAAAPSSFELRLGLVSERPGTLEQVVFPTDLLVDVSAAEAGYMPMALPGLRLRKAFFDRLGDTVFTYPSRWAFADYLALDLAGTHLAVFSANPPPAPIQPVELGFVHRGQGACSAQRFCLVRTFETWVGQGERWTSPAVIVRLGDGPEQSIGAYRTANGIDRYPSLEEKVGARLDTLVRAPLVKADLWHGLHPFREWGPDLRRLPSPALLHPVAFQQRGHDESYPDFLPPQTTWGSSDDFRKMTDDARSLGQLVMPYLNVSWWDDESPTLKDLPPPLTADALSVRGRTGIPLIDEYGGRRGYVVSPWVPFVRDRIARMLDQWRTEVPADCLFFDQLGARAWRRDFNPSAPSPLAYDDGWLAFFAPYANRCLMVEDGWDRLAQAFAGFHGSVVLLDRQFDEPNELFGAGNWEPYPLAVWLLHDKALLYQHDLYEKTMTADAEVLTFNLAFGFQLSYDWDGYAHTLDSPWVGLVGELQRTLGPLYAGKPLTEWRTLADGVTESRFGDLTLVANWRRDATFELDGRAIAPLGFLARTGDGSVVAAALAGPRGTEYLLHGSTIAAARR
jgi:hypothetical protein